MEEDVIQEELLAGAPYIETDRDFGERVSKIQEDLESVRDFGDDLGDD